MYKCSWLLIKAIGHESDGTQITMETKTPEGYVKLKSGILVKKETLSKGRKKANPIKDLLKWLSPR